MNALKESSSGEHTHKKTIDLTGTKKHVAEKYDGDIVWGQDVAPDLLESVMEPSGLVKEELRRIVFKVSQFINPNQRIRGFDFWDVYKSIMHFGNSTGGCLQKQRSS